MSEKIFRILKQEAGLSSDYNDSLRQNPNNLSNWFPIVKDCGIRVPDTLIIQCPDRIIKASFMDKFDEDEEMITDWLSGHMSEIREAINDPVIFVKNGTFSNKFDANASCLSHTYNLHELVDKIININYTALMFGADGTSELVFRKLIPYEEEMIPCIYNGLPFRPEYRVFYDFDTHEVLYSVNYWDWDYCYKAISRNATDRIVFEAYYDLVERAFKSNKEYIEEQVALSMKDITGLTGKWSIDIMQEKMGINKEIDKINNFWLIDMAIAERSAYWNPDKCTK